MKDEQLQQILNKTAAYRKKTFSRRRFIKGLAAAGAVSQLGFLQSCVKEFIPPGDTLSKKQYNILIRVQNILFPKDDLGPGAFDFNAHEYLLWVLEDERIDPDDRQYLINGIDWTAETADENFSRPFLDLSKKKQEDLIGFMTTQDWGESWLSSILTYIFEAMISDPLYGFNTDGLGWKWLEHQVGYPRPDKAHLYDRIFTTVQKNNP